MYVTHSLTINHTHTRTQARTHRPQTARTHTATHARTGRAFLSLLPRDRRALKSIDFDDEDED